jgi:hypothetical protein
VSQLNSFSATTNLLDCLKQIHERFFHLSVNRPVSLSNVDLATFAGEDVYTQVLQFQAIPEQDGGELEFPMWQANPVLLPGQQPAKCCCLDMWQQSN